MTSHEPSTPASRLANEQQAIAHLKQRNLAGLAFLVETYQVDAVHTALLIVGDRGTAEEIVQEAFLRAYHKIDQFDDRRSFGPWFLRSVINASLKTANQQKRAEPLEEQQDDIRVAEWLIDPDPDPLEIAEKAETGEMVWRALQQLTPDQRVAVVLRFYLDESMTGMIRKLDRPQSTIKWWLHTAYIRLRQILGSHPTGEPGNQEVDHE
jgi:RNA polymerase sigma-70 factor, ECF subfamily